MSVRSPQARQPSAVISVATVKARFVGAIPDFTDDEDDCR